jgi:hypothetical protein
MPSKLDRAKRRNRARPQLEAPGVFVSHAHCEARLAKLFVQMLVAAGIPPSRIYCTSQAARGVRAGRAFEPDIRKMLWNASIIIVLISPDYLERSFCLCELGGAWALDGRDRDLLIYRYPTVTTAELPGVIAARNCVALDDRDKLDELYNLVAERVETPAKPRRWAASRAAFLSALDARLRGWPRLREIRDQLPRDGFHRKIRAILLAERDRVQLGPKSAREMDARHLPFFLEKYVAHPWRDGDLSIEAVCDVLADDILLCDDSTWLWADERYPKSDRHWRVFNQLVAAVRKRQAERGVDS